MANDKAGKRQKRLAKERRRAAERAEKFLSEEAKGQRLAMFEKFAAMVRQTRAHKDAVNHHLRVDLPAYEPWFKENFPGAGTAAADLIIEAGRLNTAFAMIEGLAKDAGKKETPWCRELAATLPEGSGVEGFVAAARAAYAARWPDKAAKILADEEQAAKLAAAADDVRPSEALSPMADDFTTAQVEEVLEKSKNEVFLNPAAHLKAVEALCRDTQEKLRKNAALRTRQETTAPSWGFAALDEPGREKLKSQVQAMLAQKRAALAHLVAEKRERLARLCGWEAPA